MVTSIGLDTITDKLRKTPVIKRLEESIIRISDMRIDGRPPKTSIPVQYTDDDFYITTTLKDAIDEIASLRAYIKSTWVSRLK